MRILSFFCLLCVSGTMVFSEGKKDADDLYFERLRGEFPYLIEDPSFIYFDSGATSHKPQAVIDVMMKFYSTEYATVHRSGSKRGMEATHRYDNARKKVQNFLNAKYPEEIIFTRGTTDSINMLAISFGKAFIQEGDEIIVSEMEHHSNIIPWQVVARDHKAILKVIPMNARGELILSEYDKLLSPKTKLVSVAHVANSTGTVNPVEYIIKKAHRVGAKVMIDGAQSVAHMPVDVRAMDADFYVFSAHKIYGPSGLGILYGKKSLLERMPPSQGGGAMGLKVTMEECVPKELPLKFEAGTPPIAQVMGLGEAIDFVEKVGRNRIAKRESALLSYATEKMEKLPGVTIIGTASKKAGIITFSVQNISPFDVESYLDTKKIAIRAGYFCAQPAMRKFAVQGAARVSFGVYNTNQEIDFFVDALKEAIDTIPGIEKKSKRFTSLNDDELDSESPEKWY